MKKHFVNIKSSGAGFCSHANVPSIKQRTRNAENRINK